ncbi:hypothetical protein KBC54_01950 [Patescibacteria group bacterium]|nr:hypothetical protein [Patescibacteria group bacterium]
MNEEQREKRRDLYEALADTCVHQGLKAYLPHLVSDPTRAASLTPEQVDDLDREAVVRSLLVVACVDEPSSGVGIEIEMAYHANRPIILVYPHSTRVSRLVLGSPAARLLTPVGYTGIIDAKVQLAARLSSFLEKFNDPSRPELLRLHLLP